MEAIGPGCAFFSSQSPGRPMITAWWLSSFLLITRKREMLLRDDPVASRFSTTPVQRAFSHDAGSPL